MEALQPSLSSNKSILFDVFLSYHTSDIDEVDKIASALKDRGIKVWFDDWELIPGRPWGTTLEQIIETTKSAIVFVGRDGLGPWEKVEMRALLRQFVKRKLPVIPVLLPGACQEPKLPLFLDDFKWVDLRSGLKSDGLDRLEWGILGQRPHGIEK